MPRLKLMEEYAKASGPTPSNQHVGYLLRTSPDWSYLSALREEWEGPLVVKGLLNPADAKPLQDAGVDALWLSNHAGRQFDAAPAPIEVLSDFRAATDLPLILDSGISGGLDILRALAMGADFVMMGRAWHYALGALGEPGADHLINMLSQDRAANMGQIGAKSIAELPDKLFKPKR
jgi:L-lactate dehydrogenase (cytochrome)